MSSLKRSNFLAWLCVVITVTSCCNPSCPVFETIEIPCSWHTPVGCNLTTEDPVCFRWWEALDDAMLTSLVEQAACRNLDVRLAVAQSNAIALDTVNSIAAETAKTYIQLRGSQQRSKLLAKQIDAVKRVSLLSEGLTIAGILNDFDQLESQIHLNSVLTQKSVIDLAIQKNLFHLSTLLSYPPGYLDELCQNTELPTLPCSFPVGTPLESIQHHPSLHDCSKLKGCSLQKQVLKILEDAENALAAFNADLEKMYHMENIHQATSDVYQMTLDLYNKGHKDDFELLKADQNLLSQDDALIQSKIDLLIDYINYYQAISVGWTF